jgi:hypothetical protein
MPNGQTHRPGRANPKKSRPIPTNYREEMKMADVETPNLNQAQEAIAVLAWLLDQRKISQATYDEAVTALDDAEAKGELEGL